MTDLVRRRAVFRAGREESGAETIGALRDAAVTLHGWLAWIPARLTAIGYAVAGHFDAALGAWRGGITPNGTTSENSERLLARVGVAALAVRGATAAKRLVFRLLLIWAVIIAAMTLYGWTV